MLVRPGDLLYQRFTGGSLVRSERDPGGEAVSTEASFMDLAERLVAASNRGAVVPLDDLRRLRATG